MKKMTGMNGRSRDGDAKIHFGRGAMINVAPNLPEHLPGTIAQRRPTGPTTSHMLHHSFHFVCVRLLHLSAAMCLSFVLAMRLKKSPSGSMTRSTTLFPVLLLWFTRPEPSKWKQSWEAVYRSLMPHRASTIQDDFRACSIWEFPADRLPHGNPGPWTIDSA